MRNSSRRYELVVVHCDRNTIKKIINFGLDLLGYNCRSTIKIKKNDENLQQQKKKKNRIVGAKTAARPTIICESCFLWK